MRFLDFKKQFAPFIVFSSNDIEKYYPDYNKMNLVNWQKMHLITKIRNGWYCFTDADVNERFLFFVSNKIYSPSYVSLESALSFYGVIPEGVFSVQAVSTLKTNDFRTPFGNFQYKSFKNEMFFGYQLLTFGEYSVRMADLEKAVLDYLYLKTNVRRFDFDDFRWNKKLLQEKINIPKLKSYANFINSKTLLAQTNRFIQYSDDNA